MVDLGPTFAALAILGLALAAASAVAARVGSAVRDSLPAAVTSRPKEGFDIPAHHWLRTTLRPLLEDTLNESSVRANGLFRWPVVEKLLRDHQERRANLGYHLWGLLVLFLWMKRWNITGPSQNPLSQPN